MKMDFIRGVNLKVCCEMLVNKKFMQVICNGYLFLIFIVCVVERRAIINPKYYDSAERKQ